MYKNAFILQMGRQCSIASFQLPLEQLELFSFGDYKSLHAQDTLPTTRLAIKKELEKKERLTSQSLQSPAFGPGILLWEICFGFRFPEKSPLRMLYDFLKVA